MLRNSYPEHDINQVFDYIDRILAGGDAAEAAGRELKLINSLFAALPVMGVEYGMQFLHGRRDLPENAQEILPLYIRFVNLVEYCELVEAMRQVPKAPTREQITDRMKMNSRLDELETAFAKPLLGFALGDNNDTSLESVSTQPDEQESAPIANNLVAEQSNTEGDNEGSGNNLHLMIASASIFPCKDPIKTALFYETRCGFTSTHLMDEAMPQIRLKRDNIEIVLVEADGDPCLPNREKYGIPYDLVIYSNEPKMLEIELSGQNVNIVKPLPSADEFQNVNREFVFEDNDGRHICISQIDTQA